MKVRVELDHNETIEDAETFLTKSVAAKNECSGNERYADDYLNELESYVCSEHKRVLELIGMEISEEIAKHASE